MLLATLLVPALTSAAFASEPNAAHDPVLFDLSYVHLAEGAPGSTALEPQVRGERERVVYPATRLYSPWYFGIHGGFTSTRTSRDSDVSVDFDDGFLLGAALGYRFQPAVPQTASWSAEFEVVWTEQDFDTSVGPVQLSGSDMTALALYLNGILDFLFTPRFGAYAGAGLGLAWVDVSDIVDDPFEFRDEDGPFLTWQLKAGLQALFGERTTLRLGYRFMNIDDVELDDSFSDASFDLETRQHVIELGILFGF